MEFLLALTPVLTLTLFVLLAWLAARVLHQALLGRVGQGGRGAILAAVVAGYALLLALVAVGGPRVPFIGPLMPTQVWTVVLIVGTLLALRFFLGRVPVPTPSWLGFVLDSPIRRLFAPAEVTLSRLALGPGMRVLEVGCGTGILTGLAAERVRPGGVVFAVDVQPAMVEKTSRRVERQGLDNVAVFVAPADRLPSEVYDVDLVYMAQVLGEIPDRLAALREAYRVLRPTGVLSISESIIDPHYRTRTDVARLGRQAGFEPVSVEGSIFNYTATFRKPRPKESLGYVPRNEWIRG